MATFWDFALASYARPGVAACCLELQDSRSANVMLLLYCCWRAETGEAADATSLRAAQARSMLIDAQLVRPLRAARRALRAAAGSLDSQPLAEAAARVQRAELAGERLQASLLGPRSHPAPAVGTAQARACAARAVAVYLGMLGEPAAPARARGDRLAALVFGS